MSQSIPKPPQGRYMSVLNFFVPLMCALNFVCFSLVAVFTKNKINFLKDSIVQGFLAFLIFLTGQGSKRDEAQNTPTNGVAIVFFYFVTD